MILYLPKRRTSEYRRLNELQAAFDTCKLNMLWNLRSQALYAQLQDDLAAEKARLM